MTRPAIVFDLDGTLADSARDLIGTLNVILESEGVPPTRFEQARDLIGAGAKPLIERGFALQGVLIEPDRLDALYAAFLEHYHANIANETVLFEGAQAALEQFAADGWTLAVCTNKLESHARTLLKALGVADMFAAIAGKDSYPWFKPDPRHLLSTLVDARSSAHDAIMVGDSRTDIDTARAAGVPVVAVTFGYTQIPVRELNPDVAIDHFRELWPAVQSLTPWRKIA